MKRLVFLLTLLCVSITASANFEDRAKLPDKPGVELIKPLIKAINSDNEQTLKSFIEANFHPSFLNRFPMQAHTRYLLQALEQHGELTYHSVRRYTPALPENEIVVIVRTGDTELWHAITLFINAGPTNTIEGLDISPARTPSNLPPMPALTAKELSTQIDNYVTRLTAKDKFSGTVLLAKGEKVLVTGATGNASKRFNVANNLQTKFNLGSMNKMFTAVAVLQLAEAGKLSLSDTIDKYVDASWLPTDISSKIKVEHLLTHSSGLGSYFNEQYWDSSKLLFRHVDDFKTLLEKETLAFEPGSSNRYSNTGMLLLGVIVESVTGQSYFDYVSQNIFAKAGMINTDSYEMDQPITNLAIGYTRDKSSPVGWVNNIYAHVIKGGPAGGGYSTVEDLHRFSMALTGYKLLSEEMTEKALTAKPALHSFRYGYGFSVRGSGDERVVGHNGGFDGVSAEMEIHMGSGYTAVVLSNYSNAALAVSAKIRELIGQAED